ncbi:carbohydrate ABC transporter permease [Phytoactinopolyspora halotolerans]|uniref:Carbohydrate ABC transporter permease n=1 Tax=Phytoactinopolyspora halotolerans TaxID=1981512 RepID=A0A6L9SAP6_9ACTN|nr:carbohydrate ABC transporter permease [Phytoactinopolyspora halotolerans]NEE02435.1 carbohydrate ABC transporter permease [Phytoactinopolyspora halotolerans]
MRYAANRPVWMEKPSPLLTVVKAATLATIVALVLFPFLVVVSTSLSTEYAIAQAGGVVVIPTEISFAAYEQVLFGGVVARALLVSIGVTGIGVVLSVSATVLAAYGLSRPDSFAHRPLLFTALFTLLFAPGIIPLYLTVKQLGLLDSYWSLILPTAMNAFNFVIVRTFFSRLPQELFDAARVDGASELRILLRIVLPISKAVVSVIALFYGVAYWNAFFNAMLFITDESKWPLQVILRLYGLQGQQLEVDPNQIPPPQQATQMAIVVLAIIPILIVFPFVQRHFTKGVVIGAVKG